MSSRLFMDLRERHGLSYSINVSTDFYKDIGIFYIQTGFDKDSLFIKNFSNFNNENDLQEALKNSSDSGPGGLPIIIQNLIKLKKEIIDNQELEKVKGFLKGNLVLTTEDSHNLTDYYGKQVLHKYDPIESFDHLLENYQKIDAKKIFEIANKYFTINNLNISVLGNYTKEEIDQFINEYCKDIL